MDNRYVYLFLLLLEHLGQDGHEPVLELAVVGVGHEEVADTVDALTAQVAT